MIARTIGKSLTTPPDYQIIPERPFNITEPLFLLGVGSFFMNRFSDILFNVPLLETLLPFIMLALVVRDGTLMRLGRAPGVLLFAMFIFWITLSNIVNQLSFFGQFRNTVVLFSLVLPVILYSLLKNRQPLMLFMLGVIVGGGLYFACITAISVVDGGIPRGLRNDQPTPAVVLAILALFNDKVSRPLKTLIYSLVIIALSIAVIIQTRGAMLSLLFAAIIYIVARIVPFPRLALPVMVIFGLVAHYISSFFILSSYDAVMESGNDTISNLERAYAIDYSRMVIDSKPWFGDSPQDYAINFTDYFLAIAKFVEPGDKIASPHNTFLEYAVFFGIPAAILFVLMVARLIYAGAMDKQIARTLAVALGTAGIIRLGAFYGYSGTLRLEWFALMFVLLYHYQPKFKATTLTSHRLHPRMLSGLSPEKPS